MAVLGAIIQPIWNYYVVGAVIFTTLAMAAILVAAAGALYQRFIEQPAKRDDDLGIRRIK